MKRKSSSSGAASGGPYPNKKPRKAFTLRVIRLRDYDDEDDYVPSNNEDFDRTTIDFSNADTRVYQGTCEDCSHRQCRIVKCKTPACDKPKQECWLEHGYCMWCRIFINANGYSIVDKINNPLYCQLCFKSLLGIGTSLQNNADLPDWQGRKYHQLCWKQLSQ